LSFTKDSFASLSRGEMLYFTTFYRFAIKYRQTFIGPVWVVVQPIAFIVFLGALFVGLSNVSTSEFIPHLAIGYVAWTLLGGYLSRCPGIFSRNKAYIVDGNRSLTDAVLLDNLELIVHFAHQLIILLAVCLIFFSAPWFGVLKSMLGLSIIILNGYSFSVIFSIMGSRFKDLQEAVPSLSSILFLATPIIWMPGPISNGSKGKILETYMNFNPFYHFLEIFRAPLLSTPISNHSWIFVGVVTVLGLVVSSILYRKYNSIVPHWVS